MRIDGDFEDVEGGPNAVAVDDACVYWNTLGARDDTGAISMSLVAMPKDGGDAAVFEGYLTGDRQTLTVDATGLYVATSNYSPKAPDNLAAGSIVKIPRR